jgi:hypothetical protein
MRWIHSVKCLKWISVNQADSKKEGQIIILYIMQNIMQKKWIEVVHFFLWKRNSIE